MNKHGFDGMYEVIGRDLRKNLPPPGNARDVQMQHNGLLIAMELLHEIHEEAIQEHENLSPTIFGTPRRRHYELMAVSRVLKKLGWRYVRRGSSMIRGDKK